MQRILFIICAILPLAIFSQSPDNFKFKSLSSIQGVSVNDVDYIVQDSIGYLWFASGSGLDRFNGRSFKHYNKVLRSSYDVFVHDQKLYVDHNENLWLLNSDGQLEKYNYQTEIFKPVKNIKNPRCIIHRSNGDILVGTVGNGIFKIDQEKKDTLQILPKEFLNENLHSFTEYKDKVYASTYDRIFEIKNDDVRSIEKTGLVDSSFTVLASSKEHSVWLGTENKGLLKLNEASGDFEQFPGFDSQNTIPEKIHISYLLFDYSNRLWVSTFGDGIFLIDFENKKIRQFKSNKFDSTSLIHSGAKSMYVDNHERIWISTVNGVNYYDKFLFKFNKLVSKNLPRGKNISIVRSIDMDSLGNLWLSTLNSGISKINLNKEEVKTYTTENSELKSNKAWFAKVIDGKVWIIHYEKDIQILTPPDNFKDLNLNKDENIFTYGKEIFQDSENNVWLLTTDTGLIQYNLENNSLEKIYLKNEKEEDSRLYTVYSITEGNNKNLWLGTFKKGLIRYNIMSGETTLFKDVLRGSVITDIYASEDGSLWITSSKGLLHFDPENGEKKLYSKNEGFSNNLLMSILPHKDELWLSSSRGLIRFNKITEEVKNFKLSDGLQALEFNPKARYKDPNTGTLYFGGENGINWFHPEEIKTNPYPPETVISNLELFDEQVPLKEINTFNHDENTFIFSYYGLHYSVPERNKYKYRLKNYDQNWVNAKNKNSVRYTNLPPGDYEFEVMSANYDGIWDKTPASYKFSILKPWYGTNLAKIMYILLISGLIYAIYVYLKGRWILQAELEAEHQEAERLKELDELKTRLYTNISHEFRTPLTLILGPLERQLKNPDLNPDEKKDLKSVKRNSDRLLKLVDQLMDLSKLETGSLSIAVKNENISPLLKQIISLFEFQFDEKNIDFKTEVNLRDKIWIDKEVVEKVITNLLSNALKYTPEHGFVECNIKRDEDNLIIEVINNGVKIPAKDLSKLFKRYYQTKSNNIGTGIGLALVRELCILSHGSIEANFIQKEIIKFTAKLPCTLESYHPSEVVSIKSEAHEIKEEVLLTERNKAQKQTILIVEDDAEIRKFIKSIFKKEYSTKTARNGKEGIEISRKYIPDIIISDVMMPELSGVEMVSKLKSEELTCHIPVILLTAKSGNINEIEGLKSGADDYITKPFNEQSLKLKVNNLISLQKNNQQKFSLGYNLEDIPITDLDEKFLLRLQNITNDHIKDSNLTAKGLAKKMNMSRTQLHRKITALTGKSTTEFIRAQRCLLAKRLLKRSDLNVSEIAYKIGYNSPSYFIRSFKKEFKISPNAFRNQKN